MNIKELFKHVPEQYEPTQFLQWACENKEVTRPEPIEMEKTARWICHKLLYHKQNGTISTKRIFEFEGFVLISALRFMESNPAEGFTDSFDLIVRERLCDHFKWVCRTMLERPGTIAESIHYDLVQLSENLTKGAKPKPAGLIFDVCIDLHGTISKFKTLPSRSQLKNSLKHSMIKFSNQSLSEILVYLELNDVIKDKAGRKKTIR